MGLWDVWDEIADTAVNITSDVVYPGTAPASYEAEAYRDAADQTADWLLDTTEYLLAEGLLPAAAPAVALGGVAHAGPISALPLNSFDLFKATSDTASEWVRSAPGPI